MEQRKCDFWGLTSSKEHHNFYYVGSYFLVFKKNVFLSHVFQNFLLNIKRLENKSKIITEYEVGLSRTLIKAGFKKDCFTKTFLNMPLVTEDTFYLFSCGFPLIKGSLLKNNPKGTGNVYRWKQYCPLNIINMIENHLQRIIGNNNPSHWYIYKKIAKDYYFINKKIFRIIIKNDVLRLKILGITLFKNKHQ
jgi:hypothetical protein